MERKIKKKEHNKAEKKAEEEMESNAEGEKRKKNMINYSKHLN